MYLGNCLALNISPPSPSYQASVAQVHPKVRILKLETPDVLAGPLSPCVPIKYFILL